MTWHLSHWFHFQCGLLVFIFINVKRKLLAVFLVVSCKDSLWVRPYLLFITLHISPGARLSSSYWFYSDYSVLHSSKYQSTGICQRLHHFNIFHKTFQCISELNCPAEAVSCVHYRAMADHIWEFHQCETHLKSRTDWLPLRDKKQKRWEMRPGRDLVRVWLSRHAILPCSTTPSAQKISSKL